MQPNQIILTMVEQPTYKLVLGTFMKVDEGLVDKQRTRFVSEYLQLQPKLREHVLAVLSHNSGLCFSAKLQHSRPETRHVPRHNAAEMTTGEINRCNAVCMYIHTYIHTILHIQHYELC